MMSATEEAKQEEQSETTSVADNNENNGNKDDNNDNNESSPNPARPAPIKRSKSSSSDILTKLRNILDGVASQEADLKRKTHKIEEWYNLHRDALNLAATTKKKLIEFEIISDDDDDNMITLKTKNKTEINSFLDKLEKHLKKINLTEKKYRSRECILEQNELNETIKKLQNKYKMISKKYNLCQSDLDKLTIQNVENENKIKQLIESNKKMIDLTKKELIQKHKNYITNLQSQHENLLKKQKDENIKNMEKQYLTEKNTLNLKIENFENEIIKIKKENNNSKEIEICKHKMDIIRIENDYKMIENKLIESEEEISSFKLREKAHRELMLKWQAQKEKKNEKINNLSLDIEKLRSLIENLEENNQRLQETTAFNSIQITQKDEKFNELENKSNNQYIKIEQMDKDKKLLEAKLKVSIKEIIKLRQEIKNRDENKNKLLTEISNMEIEKNKKIKLLNIDIDKLKNEILLNNHEYHKKFELINNNLNDLHSKLESFSVTIRNFSYKSLLQNKTFDTEIEAVKKSNEVLIEWQDNIRQHVRKATEQLTISSVIDTKETQTQIAHIRLTGLQLLLEYTSLCVTYNNLYISSTNNNNKKNNNNNNNDNNNNIKENKKKFKRGK